MKTKIVFELLTPRTLQPREEGRLIFSLWKKHLPSFLPDHFGNYEPIQEIFDPNDVDSALDAWRWPFLAIKKQPKVESSVWMRRGSQALHANWSLCIESDSINQDALLNLLKDASRELHADFGCVHLLNYEEIERGLLNKTVSFIKKNGEKIFRNEGRILDYVFLLSSQKILRFLPDLYWATVFGPPYVEMFGRDRLLSAPLYSAHILDGNRALLQLSPRLIDINEKWAEIDEVRSNVKMHLDPDSFFNFKASENSCYNAPHFVFNRT